MNSIISPKPKAPSSSDSDDSNNLSVSGRWSDMEPSPDFFKNDDSECQTEGTNMPEQKGSGRKGSGSEKIRGKSKSPVFAIATASSNAIQPKQKTPSPILTPSEKDRFDAPVLWLRRTWRIPEDVLREAILKGFSDSGRPDVKIVDFFITFNPDRDHAYLILNSHSASELLLDGSVTITVKAARVDIVKAPRVDIVKDPRVEKVKDAKTEKVKETPEEEIDDLSASKAELTSDSSDEFKSSEPGSTLWFEKADHVVPKEGQDAWTLYLWQLPHIEGAKVVEMIRLKICPWCPILDLAVDEREDGICSGWAKVYLECEFDTQKCVYMLNFNRLGNTEIRASFCNTDRGGKQVGERSRSSNPRPPRKSPKEDNRKAAPPKPAPKSVDAWGVVGKEGRRNVKK